MRASRSRASLGFTVLLAAVLVAGATTSAGAVEGLSPVGCPVENTYTWVGPTGSWQDPANWSPVGVPDAADECAVISGDVGVPTATLGADVTLQDLSLLPGTGSVAIDGSADLTIGGTLDWQAGSILGSGNLTISPAGTMLVDGAAPDGVVHLGGCAAGGECPDARAVVNQGLTQLSDGGSIVADDGTAFQNEGIFEIANDGGYIVGAADASEPPRFTNGVNGLLWKSGSLGDPSIITADFVDDGGAIDIEVGALWFWGSGAIDASLDPGRQVALGSTQDTTLPDGSVVNRDFASTLSNTDVVGTGVSLDEQTSQPASSGGYDFFPFTVAATADYDPIGGSAAEIQMGVDSAELTTDASNVWVFNHGIMVPECPEPFAINPDPCAVRSTNGEGDAIVTIFTDRLGQNVGDGLGTQSPRTSSPSPYPHAKKEPITIDATLTEADPFPVSVGPGGVTPGSGAPNLGQRVEFTVTGGAMAIDAKHLGDGGTPLFSEVTDSSFLYPSGAFTVNNGAGANGTLSIKPLVDQLKPPLGHDIQVIWAATPDMGTCTGCRFDVQYRYKKLGTKKWGAWKTWQNDATAAGAIFTAGGHGSYRFRARVDNAGTVSGWSPKTAAIAVKDR